MIQTLEMPPIRHARAGYAGTSSSVDVIALDADRFQESGAREAARPWPGPMVPARPAPVFFLIDASVIDHLSWYKFCDALTSIRVSVKPEVRAYLDSHPDLFLPVAGVCRSSRQVFGPSADLSLRVYRDPEVFDESLVLRVRLSAYPANTLQCLQSVLDAHENDLWDKAGSILVTTDFCPLR